MLELPGKTCGGLKPILNVIPANQRRQLVQEFKFAFANGSNIDKQIKIVTVKGREKWIRVTGIFCYRKWGTQEQMIGAIEDITQKINEECVGLSIVNHELRAPLTIIKLNIQMPVNNIKNGKTDQQLVKTLNNVDNHINYMTGLMDEYLNFSTDDQRVNQLNTSLFDLNQLMDFMLTEMRTLHPYYRFNKAASGRVWVEADKFKIIQVLINFLTNAVKFSPRSSLIFINTYIKGSFVEVAISDEGIGVPKDQLIKIFQKFYRSDVKNASNRNSKGLGLYLVKEIIQQHGGSVRAERRPGGGSIFYFTLSLSKTLID